MFIENYLVYLEFKSGPDVAIYRKVKKPIVKKWCYTPSEESGLTDFQSLAQPAEPECPRKCEQVSPSF